MFSFNSEIESVLKSMDVFTHLSNWQVKCMNVWSIHFSPKTDCSSNLYGIRHIADFISRCYTFHLTEGTEVSKSPAGLLVSIVENYNVLFLIWRFFTEGSLITLRSVIITLYLYLAVPQYTLAKTYPTLHMISEILFVNIHLEPKVFLFHLYQWMLFWEQKSINV